MTATKHLDYDLGEQRLRRFWRYVEKTNTCWVWTGARSSLGYGVFSWRKPDGKTQTNPAHRVSFFIHRGPMTKGLQLDHLCRVRECVNPDHLEEVTGKVNTWRGEAPPAVNAKKTHCPQGHKYDKEMARNRRGCSVCREVQWKAKRQRAYEAVGHVPLPQQKDRTACPRGHAYSGVNEKGGRVCGQCAAWKARRRGAWQRSGSALPILEWAVESGWGIDPPSD